MERNADTRIPRLWQEQTREEQTMRLDDVRTKAERLDAKTRRWRVVTIAVFIVVLVWEAWQVWIQPEVLERAGDLLTIAAFLYIAWRFRSQRLAARPAALGSTSSAEFYRAELVRQRDLSEDSWGYLLPFVPGVTLSLFGGGLGDRPASQLIAIAALGVALFLGIAWWNAHTARRLQRDLDAVDAS